MKKILIGVLALILASCAPAATPVAQPTTVPPTPIVVTVVVPIVQTQIVPASPLPVVNTLAPTATVEAPTLAPTSAPASAPTTSVANTAASSASGATATATLPANAGGSLFANLTRSGSFLSMRCQPQDITFGVSTSNPGVIEVDFYYRMEDLTTQPVTISTWKNLGKMKGDSNGNYTINFNVLANMNPDLRVSAKSWFDYEFVAVGKDGTVAGRSGIISQQILYRKDCP
jgi:hypothetical protein